MANAYFLFRNRAELNAAKRFSGIMFVALFLTTPSMSQSRDLNVIPTPFDLGQLSRVQPTRREPTIVPQLMERFEPDGGRVRQRGISIGNEIASNVTVRIGLVDRKDRRSAFYPNADGNARRSGKASAILVLKLWQ